MSKDLKDYLKYYIGCRIKVMDGAYMDLTPERFAAYYNATGLNEYKLLLRPLSDMTEEEGEFRWKNFCNIKEINQEVVAEEIRWLLSKQFDIFNLIPAGLAIDKTKQGI